MDDPNIDSELEGYLRAKLLGEIKSLLESRLKHKCQQFLRSMAISFFIGSQGLFDDSDFDFVDFLKLQAKHKSETFSEMLLQLIRESGEKNSTIYTRANIDRRHFSKIANHPDYKPGKQTVLAFALALKLDFDKTRELLASAGFTLNKTILSDLSVSYFIECKKFDVDVANRILYKYGQPLLGG